MRLSLLVGAFLSGVLARAGEGSAVLAPPLLIGAFLSGALVSWLYALGSAQPLLRSRGAARPSHASAFAAAPDAGGIGLGTLASPCTGWSDYTLQRLAASPHAECRQWLAEGPLQERFLSQYKQDTFFFNNFARCMEGPGLYLDLGAYQPVRWSNTWLLDKCLGWRGLCVEADPEQAAPFRASRGCTVVPKAVALTAGKGSLIGGDWGGVAAPGYFGEGAKKPIEFATMQEILREAGVLEGGAAAEAAHPEAAAGLTRPLPTVDFVSLDVETNEVAALLGFPWDKLRARFMVIENMRGDRDVEELLALEGYVKVGSLEFDDFYALLEGSRLWWPEGGRGSQGGPTARLKRERGFPQYSIQMLYEDGGWGAVKKFAREKGAIP